MLAHFLVVVPLFSEKLTQDEKDWKQKKLIVERP